MKEASSTSGQPGSLIEKLEAHILANLDNAQFGVEQLADLMNISRSQLHRKLKKTTGKSISQFIREYRLKQAHRLLVIGDFSTSEVADKVGFGSASYFSKCFTEYFGYSPSRTRDYNTDKVLRTSGEAAVLGENKVFLKKYRYLAAMGLGLLAFVYLFSFFGKKVPNATTSSKAVLVMPFKNLSNNENNEYITLGMVDAINRHLATVEELHILSNSTLDPSKDEIKSLKEISDKYINANVLMGSLQQHGNTLRIEVKLFNVSNNEQLWAESYDRRSDNLLEIQNDIAENIALAMKARLTPEELSIINKRASYNPEAYDLFLKGWFHHNQFSKEGQRRSAELFKKAIELDSNLALAHLGLAVHYQVKATVWSAELTVEEAFKKAKPYLDKALELDPDLKEAYGWKAFEYLYNDWDFDAAEKLYKISLESEFPIFLAMWTNFLHYENRHDEGYKIAKELNDHHPFYLNNQMVLSSYFANELNEGKEFMETRLKSHSNYYTLDTSGFFLLNTGQYAKAIKLFQKAIDNEGIRFPRMLGWMGAAYAQKGDKTKAGELLSELKELKAKTDAGSPAWFVAVIHAALGDKDEALKWLTMSIDDHEMEVPWLVSEPQFYPLHGHPEFDALVKRVGFRAHAYPIKK